ncbi:hypothetical protein K491DRAFT_717377 [Lophiostoma macrostomum CBS 122681]|uniref:DUF7709 domain-containing protein n=1 Tax=Lophiostoma macrostomum CBS 122681 TaxID=1314788 RepID=A0A6A6T6M7_9PLEO|nr:hypothetical protein K491DRAFT_717377 [Lophiostoma macrostomum CBS 122681]
MASNDTLQNINSATLGAQMPIVTLPDGSKVQTGTVGALIVNIRTYNELIARGPNADEKTKTELEGKMAASLPLLKKAGMFGLFAPQEWVQGTSAGRKFVGELALKEDF